LVEYNSFSPINDSLTRSAIATKHFALDVCCQLSQITRLNVTVTVN
jgi:hypothetical protein